MECEGSFVQSPPLPKQVLQSKCLHLEFSKLLVKVEAGRCLAWALEGARGCAVSLERGLGEWEDCFWPQDSSLANWKGISVTRKGPASCWMSPVLPKGLVCDQAGAGASAPLGVGAFLSECPGKNRVSGHGGTGAVSRDAVESLGYEVPCWAAVPGCREGG